MTLLSICIPTYNRPEQIKTLYQTFLSRAFHEYGSQIEIIVCDNSDDEEASLNRSNLGPKVHYYKNKVNIDFHGNIIQCAKLANGQFIWIISDDDLILWNGFQSLMDYLPHASNECIDCIMLPYRNDDFNKNQILNDQHEWGVEKDTNLLILLNAVGYSYNHAPFCLFSNAVIRLNKKRLDWVANEFQGNYNIQIPLFLCMLKPESRLHFLDTVVIQYTATYHIGLPLPTFYKSMKDVLLFIGREYGVDVTKASDLLYNKILSLIMAHRVGICNYKNTDRLRWSLLTKLPQHLHIKTVILAFMVVMPGILIRIPYIFYLSIHYAYANDELSIKKVISNFNELHHSISLKNKKYI
ncbi:Glycosyl transferase family 2 [uncultured archaeon]|nr:Glycosyl transferase family 2 [uncultured archaeon]